MAHQIEGLDAKLLDSVPCTVQYISTLFNVEKIDSDRHRPFTAETFNVT